MHDVGIVLNRRVSPVLLSLSRARSTARLFILFYFILFSLLLLLRFSCASLFPTQQQASQAKPIAHCVTRLRSAESEKHSISFLLLPLYGIRQIISYCHFPLRFNTINIYSFHAFVIIINIIIVDIYIYRYFGENDLCLTIISRTLYIY